MAKPSGDGPLAKKTEQLITPLLTPVTEEFPDERDTPTYKNGFKADSGDAEPVFGIPRLATNDGRNRSTSLPVKHVGDPLHINGNLSSRRLLAEPSAATKQLAQRDVRKLSAAQMESLTSAPDSLPIRSASFSDHERPTVANDLSLPVAERWDTQSPAVQHYAANGAVEYEESSRDWEEGKPATELPVPSISDRSSLNSASFRHRVINANEKSEGYDAANSKKALGPEIPSWRPSTPENHTSSKGAWRNDREGVTRGNPNSEFSSLSDPLPSPLPDSLPLPPFSMPTHLHLELSSERPSPLYIHHSAASDLPYEPTSVKFERLLNFLLLPPQLERVLLFGALTCLDAWLYTFTILPLRFLKALWMLFEWLVGNVWREICYLTNFVFNGLGRLWRRRKGVGRRTARSGRASEATSNVEINSTGIKDPAIQTNGVTSDNHVNLPVKRHRRTRSQPSLLQPQHKADLLQGALIVVSCVILLKFDASRMYHGIRGQAAIKLYVIYNVLEVFDRLFSALGQDIIECLLSPETLERKPNGRSKIIRPFWMFLLALIYTVIHATAFFYQVITLNVAVNSYSNALLTLLMSNQFVEIKGTVFKKFEKENLFQLTCADVVERFQLWLMLVIIALRNIVELGGLSVGSGEFAGPSSSGSGSSSTNTTSDSPLRTFGILPNSFTILPSLFPAQVLGPFLLVLGSEMLVDWLKHAYITKFNSNSPALYSRFFDVLAKDYYSNAFVKQNLVRRLGLPTIPLACLFIRAILQTYHMFLATTISSPSIGISSANSLSVDSDPAASPALAQIDHILRTALGRSSFGSGSGAAATSSPTAWWSWTTWTLDDAIALTTMLVFFLALYLLLLALKLVLGMLLLAVARTRYRGMKMREHERVVETKGQRRGAWGTVEVGEERRRWIYEGDPEALRALREKESRARDKEKEARDRARGDRLEGVDRYRMVAKRIW